MIVEQDFAGRQFLGAREYQEDFYAFSDGSTNEHGEITSLVLALADGMGGHNAGEYASMVAVESFIDCYHTLKGEVPEKLIRALHAANRQLRDEISRQPELLHGMGTTFVALYIHDHLLQWISVGDSPLLLYRRGTLKRLNEDHSLAPLLKAKVTSGQLTPEQASVHPDRHTLRSALLGDGIDLIDSPDLPYDLQRHDIIICASDGLLTLNDHEVQQRMNLLHRLPAGEIANGLLRTVFEIQSPRQDNATVTVIKIS